MIILHLWILLGIITNVSSQGKKINLEWSLGSTLPISKVINSGTEQDLYCSIDGTTQESKVFLHCPANSAMCMDNCIPFGDNLFISCNNISTNKMIIFHYKIKVFKKHEGKWRCQYLSESSRSVELTVTNKPYINSFNAVPNPVWQGSKVIVTCQVMPMNGINGIQLSRVSSDNSTSIIPSEEPSNEYSQSVTITSAMPDRDDRLQCMVFTEAGMVSTRSLKINIYYFPKNLHLTCSSLTGDIYPIGFLLTCQCSAEGGNPIPSLSLYRQRFQRDEEKLSDIKFHLSKFDNDARIYCKMERIASVTSDKMSNQIIVKVKYSPDNIDLIEEPSGQLMESQVQTFSCLCQSGSEPMSQIEWSMTDYYGRNLSTHYLETIIERIPTYRNSSVALKESIRITTLRNLNGYTISCSIIYEHKRLFTKKRLIKVVFAPNSITLNSNPLGPIVQGTSIVLTCITGTANPPSKIQWSKTMPGQKSDDVTSHSNMDLMPANYSGVAISSTLSVHDVTKNDHGNLYRCIVSHAYLNSEIVKEYFLNVLFPPIIQVYSHPYPVEEGEPVFLQCRATGGNPNSLSQYRFQWQFCPVNSTYQRSSETGGAQKPSSEIRRYCSQNFNGLAFQQSSTLNISSVTYKHRGWYSCLIHSPGGSTTGYSFINVLYPPILTKQTPDRLYGKASTDAILKLEVLSNPLEIDVKWFFQPQQTLLSRGIHDQMYETKVQQISTAKKEILMKPFGRFESIVFDNYTVLLVIRSLSYLDYGDYYCEVSNRIGKKGLKFQLFPTNEFTIPETSLNMQFNGRNVLVSYEPPSQGHFTHLILRICSQEGAGNCRDMHISNPLSGKASTTLHRPPGSFTYRILVYNGSSLLQITNPIQKNFALQSGNWVEMSFEMTVAVIIGVVGILILLFATMLTLLCLKCKQTKSKENLFVENSSNLTANSHRRHDYLLLNSSANTTLLKNGCHCFPNYPMELRSDNGSDHSAPSQDTRIYHPMMMRRKIRDNSEINSVHSGGSCQSPDVVLTEKTSLGSGNNQNFIGTPQFSSLGSGTPNKVSFLSGRLHSFDGQRHDSSLAEEFSLPQNMVFAAVDDGTNPTRLIPIATKNLHAEYPLYYQMNNQATQKPYDTNPSSLYSMSLPRCTKPCRNDTYRENSSSTNTDSNHYSTANDPSVVDATNGTVDIRNVD